MIKALMKKTTTKKSIPTNMQSEPKAAFNWFPGHMLKARRDIEAKIKVVDLIIEIRDARAPLVSGNPFLKNSIGGKTLLIILNKVNLADKQMVKAWEEWFKKQEIPFLFVNCLEKSSNKMILSKAKNVIEAKRKASSPDFVKPKDRYRFMVVGLPNTGKSTFINQFANRNATKTANKPGETRHQLWVKVDDDLELLDTPGIMPPKLDSDSHKIFLSVINAIPDGIVGEETGAYFITDYFLKRKSTAFATRYKLESFDLSAEEVFQKIAAVRGCLRQKGVVDLERVYKIILMDFREGLLGESCFETPPN